MIQPKTIACLLLVTSLVSCAPISKISPNQEIVDYVKSIKVADPQMALPNMTQWKADRDAFVTMLTTYEAKNSLQAKKNNTTKSLFTVGGIAVGVGGGIYGLTQKEESKGAAITSLVAGGITAIASALNVQKRAERSSACNDFLNDAIIEFKGSWGDISYPNTKDKYASYTKSKEDLIKRMRSMKCYGLQNESF